MVPISIIFPPETASEGIGNGCRQNPAGSLPIGQAREALFIVLRPFETPTTPEEGFIVSTRIGLRRVSGLRWDPPPFAGLALHLRPQPGATISTQIEAQSENLCRAEGGSGYAKLEELLVEETWLEALPGELQKPYAKNLCKFVESEICGGTVPVYPPLHLIFNALNSTPFDGVKAVIIGQDPYHGPGQAMGLSFSVPLGVKVPSSLVNIFKELKQDLGCSIPSHGNLEKWAVQGVLLLNAVLTVRSHQANSHAKKGWEQFTDAVIKTISQKKKGVVFLLWGNSAQQKSKLVDETKHHILKAAHPSGLSAHRGFFGCRHFSQTNQLLEQMGNTPIEWQL